MSSVDTEIDGRGLGEEIVEGKNTRCRKSTTHLYTPVCEKAAYRPPNFAAAERFSVGILINQVTSALTYSFQIRRENSNQLVESVFYEWRLYAPLPKKAIVDAYLRILIINRYKD